MSLDINACLKAFCIAFSQYRDHHSDQTLKLVERQIDVLIGISSNGKPLRGFTVKELLPTECLTSLVFLLTERNDKIILTSKSLSLLYHLASNCSETRVALRDSYQLTSTLTGLLLFHCSQQSPSETIIFQCLQLLQLITYDFKLPVTLGCIEELVKFLINQIQSCESDLTLPSLGTLANLCRNNIAIQSQIKGLDNIRYLYRILVRLVSHDNLTVIVYALSLLKSLALHEQDVQLGDKLFHARNVNQTFQLVFNILINGDAILARKCAVDLFVDILRSEQTRTSLLNFDHLHFYLENVLTLLSECEADVATKIFEFLLAFCAASELRSSLLQAFLSSVAPDSGLSLESDDNFDQDAFCGVMFWVNKSIDDDPFVSVKALEFLKEVFEEIVNHDMSSDVSDHVKILIPNLVDNLKPPDNVEGRTTEKNFEKISCVLDLLSVLASEEAFLKLLRNNLKGGVWRKLVEQQYSLNDIVRKEKLSFTADWSEVGVLVALKSLDLMNRLKLRDEKMSTAKDLMQDDRLVTFLAYTLINGKKEDIQTALRVLQESSKHSDFRMARLGEQIFDNNVSKEEELTFLRQRQDEVVPSPSSTSVLDPSHSIVLNNPFRGSQFRRRRGHSVKTSTFINSYHDESSIETLIDKMKSGMEIRDPKASEIMDIYEAKLASLQTKEIHMQDLIEAKTQALRQSDSMISQYRARRAQFEVECAKLRQMLQETEKRCEAQVEEINNLIECEKIAAQQMEQLKVQNRNLQLIVSEHEQLKIIHAEQNQRVDTLKNTLTAAQEQQKSLTEMNEMLRRHNDNLKSQHDCATRQIQELEAEIKKALQQLVQKDTKTNELLKVLEKKEEVLHQKEKETEKIRKCLEQSKVELLKSEQTRKELIHKVASLELICSQREETVKKKEQLLKEQREDLDKYAQMSAMIHTLTSGKVPITKH